MRLNRLNIGKIAHHCYARRLALVVSLAAMPALEAATVIVNGTQGSPGSPGTADHPDGGDGQGGFGANASLTSAQSPEQFFTVTASGGNGGAGGNGNGLPPGNGGHGAPGGGASANADLTRTSAGNVGVTVEARGGGGGFFGLAPTGSTSGSGAGGGAAVASGAARTVGSSSATVTVTARGGSGNESSAGTAPSGGSADITNAYGESGSGTVRVTATAVSGSGGTGLPNTNGLSIGVGGDSQSVNLDNVVDGNTQGQLFLTQTATAGGAAGGLAPGQAGDARSALTRNIAAGTLTMAVNANGGRGAPDNHGHGAGSGGNASTIALATNPLGRTVVTVTSRGGFGGDQQTETRFRARPAHDGGDATSVAYGEGASGRTVVRSYAYGGRGGNLLGPGGAGSSDAPGSGGNAWAEADGVSLVVGQEVNVESIARGGQSGTRAGAYLQNTLPRAKAGRAVAIANGEGLANTIVSALAVSESGAEASEAVSHASGAGSHGQVSAEAISAWRIGANQINRTRVYVESNLPGQADIGASAIHDGYANPTPPPQLSSKIGARAGSHVSGNVYDGAHFFAHADPGLSAPHQISMEVSIEYNDLTLFPFDPADDLLIDLTQISVDPGGFDRIDFSVEHVNANRTVAVTLLDTASALNFFANPINLGQIGTFFLGGPSTDIRILFDITLSQPGQGIEVMGAGAVPLPAAVWMLLGALGFLLGLGKSPKYRDAHLNLH